MKKWVWAVATVIIIIIAGGLAYTSHHNVQAQYDSAMNSGKLAVQDKRYTAAETSFQAALRHKDSDKTAQAYLSQAQNYVTGNAAMNDGNFSTAKSAFTKVQNAKNGYTILTKRAKTSLKRLKPIRLRAEMYTQIYEQAVIQYQAQTYTESNATLDRILTDKDAKQSYYQDTYNKAVELRSANNKAIKNGGDGTPASDSSSVAATTSDSSSSTTATTDSSSATSSSSVSGLTKAESEAAKNYKGTNEYTVKKSQTEINGKTITSAQISAARKTLKNAGVQESSFSDQDIRTGLIAANKAGISYKSYVNKNYK
ncbi:hypothetical protein [Secundilactobacillus collinoides]|uniref:Uncharacterized protein n=1 Tax=Secundilactobacillus collinoides TaxID=33960 RepID=A0A166G3P0_SECCO|nr:hypothetical protein [Secundilactobacillus collinoides]KZL36704.1 hypothetical protein TY91_13765 [Secundilactobacillus collinoides]